MIFDSPLFLIWALYLDFEDAKNNNVLKVLLWGFGERRNVLLGVWYLDLDLDIVIGFC